MKYLHFPSTLNYAPIRLTEEELKDPMSIVIEFFEFYSLNQLRIELGNLLEYALGTDDPDMEEPNKRVDLVQFSYQLEALFEATYILHLSHSSGRKK